MYRRVNHTSPQPIKTDKKVPQNENIGKKRHKIPLKYAKPKRHHSTTKRLKKDNEDEKVTQKEHKKKNNRDSNEKKKFKKETQKDNKDM